MNDTCDVLIVGGGLVGASLACALEVTGVRTVLAEAAPPVAPLPPSFDERNLALAAASVNALDALGVLRHLLSAPAPIERIHVSSRGDFGAVRMDARERGIDAFGQVVIARELGIALDARLGELRHVERLRPARVLSIETREDAVLAQVSDGSGQTRTLRTRLLVAADGTDSTLRSALGIGADSHDYAQTLFVSVIQAERDAARTAYERFTPDGPVAMLPLGGTRLGSVLTVARHDADAVAALDDAAYLDLVQQRFGWRLGRLQRVGRRHAYPLRRVCAERLVAPRAVLVGNAAQTLHPIGAQGFNLGLRDALTLAEVIVDNIAAHDDPGAAEGLERHATRRAADREQTMAFSDGLARLFSNTFARLRALRSLGLLALERVPGLDAGLVAGAMGFRGDVPALALRR